MLREADLEEEVSMEYSGDPYYIELNGFSEPKELDHFLHKNLEQFKRIAADTNMDKNKLLQDDISKRLFSVKSDIVEIMAIGKRIESSNYSALFQIKIDYCDKALLFLSNLKTEIFKLTKSNSGRYTNLTEKQIVIFFYHMQNLGYIGKGIDKNDFAKLLSELTDYSFTQIRKDLSHIKKESQSLDSLEFKETDYTIINREIKKVLKAINKDAKDKFQPNP